MSDGKFTGRDNAFGFIANVKKDLFAVNLYVF